MTKIVFKETRLIYSWYLNVVFAVAMTYQTISPDSITTATAIRICFVISFVSLIFFNLKYYHSVFNMMNCFMVVFLFFYIMSATFIINGNTKVILLPDWTLKDLNKTLMISFFAFTATANGYLLSTGKYTSEKLQIFKIGINDKKLKYIVFTMIILSAIFMIIFLKSFGIRNYLLNMGNMRTSEEFLGKTIYSLPMIVFANISALLMSNTKNKVYFFLIVLYAIMVNMLSGYRVNIGFLLCSIVIVKYTINPFKIKFKHLFVLVAILLIIGPIPLALRGKYGGQNFVNYKEQVAYVYTFFSSLDPDIYLTLVNRGSGVEPLMAITSKMTSVGDIQCGKFLLTSLVVGFIPHAIWPDRPPAGAEIMKTYFWGDFIHDIGSPATTMVGEVYFDGGILGVGLAFFVFGILIKSIERFRTRSGQNLFPAILYAVYFWYFAVMSNENFSSSVGSLVIYFVVLTCIYKISMKQDKHVKYAVNI